MQAFAYFTNATTIAALGKKSKNNVFACGGTFAAAAVPSLLSRSASHVPSLPALCRMFDTVCNSPAYCTGPYCCPLPTYSQVEHYTHCGGECNVMFTVGYDHPYS
jgi:hypothetical protein